MNYMKQVAEMLGMELGEEFTVGDSTIEYRLSESGLEYLTETSKSWWTDDGLLSSVLRGTIKIKKQPFKPKREEIYWYVTDDGTTLATQNGYSPCRLVDQYNILHGNCYRTREEAEKHRNEWVRFFREAVE